MSQRSQSQSSMSSNTKPNGNMFNHSIFVWSGKEASPIVKASAITKGSELNNLFNQGRDHVLKVLFSGGVIREKKL